MDQAVTRYYREILTKDFQHFGTIENNSIYIDTVGERFSICGLDGGFLQLYVSVAGNTVKDLRYRCSCDPVTNVAVEILCQLTIGKSLDEIAGLTEKSFGRFLETEDEELLKKSRNLLELFNRGITRYRSQVA